MALLLNRSPPPTAPPPFSDIPLPLPNQRESADARPANQRKIAIPPVAP